MDFFMKYGLLGVLCRGLFILALIFVGSWLLCKLVVAIWPVLLGIAVIGAIVFLARRRANRS